MEFELQGKDKGERRDVLPRVSVSDLSFIGIDSSCRVFLSLLASRQPHHKSPFIITHFHSVFSPFSPFTLTPDQSPTKQEKTTEFWIKK